MSLARRLFSVLYLTALSLVAQAQEPESGSGVWPWSERPEETDATSGKLIELHLKARGGEEAIKASSPVRFFGTIVEGIVEESIISVHSYPDSMRVETYRYHIGKDYRTVTAIQEGRAWQQQVQPEKQSPQFLGGKRARYFDFQARIPFLFVDHEQAGHVFEYRGETTYAKRKAYLVHAWLASGEQLDLHFDAKSFLILNYRHSYQIGSQEILVDRTPIGMLNENSVWWEKGYRLHIRGKSFIRIEFEVVETNVSVEEDAFTPPKTNEFWLRPR